MRGIITADLLTSLRPDHLPGALLYLTLFLLAALLLSRALRASVHAGMVRIGHVDRTTISFFQQLGVAAIWIIALVLYAHLIPALRALGTALLTGAGIASVVIGLAAQSTLGNLVAGIAITLYRPFRLGDRLLVSAPTGSEIGTVEVISLGYTKLRTSDGRMVVVPNSIAASQVTVNFADSPPAPLAIVIRVSRRSDVNAARHLALRLAKETLGNESGVECVLTRIEGGSAVLELRVQGQDGARADALRARLMPTLAQGFAQAGLDSPTEQVSFT
ncbi:MAG: mechanosensitive ion channel family protein [Gammaproteobacteria bacterium]|nr:mechanosensitive ion channel family protein [Gammaproteobacteria bacterium]